MTDQEMMKGLLNGRISEVQTNSRDKTDRHSIQDYTRMTSSKLTS
jgi:hypothetical protein